MNKITALFKHRLGRRGSSLLFFGYVLVLTGASQLLLEPSPDPIGATEYIYNLFTPVFWGFIFLSVGTIATVASAFKRLEWVAFFLVATLFSVMAIGFSVAAIGAEHWFMILLQASTWLAFAVLVIIIAGWPEVEAR